jgi:DegV family protein with EDD domain
MRGSGPRDEGFDSLAPDKIINMSKKLIGIVTDTGADLPRDFIEKNDIQVVEHKFYFPGQENENFNLSDFYQKLRENLKKGIFPKTSFAPVAAFKDAYQKSLEKFDQVLAIILTSVHSGAYSAAEQAKNLMGELGQKIHVIDSLLAATAQGVFVIKAQELINQNKTIPEIKEFLNGFRDKIKTFAFLENYSWVKASGRLPEGVIRIMELLQKTGTRPALGIKNGKISMAGVKFLAFDRAEAIVKEIKKMPDKVKVAISHADALAEATKIKEELEKIGKEVLYITETTPVLVSHGGLGLLVVSYYAEE